MSVSTEVRDAIVLALQTSLGSTIRVFPYRGEFAKDAILHMAKTLPAVAVTCLGSRDGTPSTMMPVATYDYAAYVITKQKPSTSPLSAPGDAAMAIEEAITVQLLTGGWSHDEMARAESRKSVNASGSKGPMGDGYGFVGITWSHELTLPPEVDPSDLEDLETVNVDIDFADVAPDGEEAPDGTVDHTTTITGLDT